MKKSKGITINSEPEMVATPDESLQAIAETVITLTDNIGMPTYDLVIPTSDGRVFTMKLEEK